MLILSVNAFISWRRSTLLHWNKIHNKHELHPPLCCVHPCLVMGICSDIKGRVFSFPFKENVLCLFISCVCVCVPYSRRICFKTLTNLLPSLKFYGELDTAEINGNSLLKVSQGLILHTWNLPGNLNHVLGSAGGSDSFRENLLQQGWRLSLLDSFWSKSEDK